MSHEKSRIHKNPKMNVSYEIIGTPSCIISDPDRYLKLFNNRLVNSSTVVNLPMGSLDKSAFEMDYELKIQKTKNKNRNRNSVFKG